MRLPGQLYKHVKHCMDGHASWHIARLNPAVFDAEGANAIAAARLLWPGVKCMIDLGSGEQFLEFHRQMLREFKWIVADTKEPDFYFDEWKAIPDWVAKYFDPGFLDGFAQALPAYIDGPSVDALGAFVESTPRGIARFHGVHNACHGKIDMAESILHPRCERLNDASMLELKEAPHNEYFWSLHSWIDGIYAAWQVKHGVPVEDSPKQPGGHHPAMDVRMTPSIRAYFRRLFLGNEYANSSGALPHS